MGFEACHPAVNFIFFASVLWGTVSFQHPVFLAIAWLCAFAYSVRRSGQKAVIFNLSLLPLIVIFALYYSAYHDAGKPWLRAGHRRSIFRRVYVAGIPVFRGFFG